METLISQKERRVCKLNLIFYGTLPCRTCNVKSGIPALVDSFTETQPTQRALQSSSPRLLSAFSSKIFVSCRRCTLSLTPKSGYFKAVILLNSVLLSESQLLYIVKQMQCETVHRLV